MQTAIQILRFTCTTRHHGDSLWQVSNNSDENCRSCGRMDDRWYVESIYMLYCRVSKISNEVERTDNWRALARFISIKKCRCMYGCRILIRKVCCIHVCLLYSDEESGPSVYLLYSKEERVPYVCLQYSNEESVLSVRLLYSDEENVLYVWLLCFDEDIEL